MRLNPVPYWAPSIMLGYPLHDSSRFTSAILELGYANPEEADDMTSTARPSRQP